MFLCKIVAKHCTKRRDLLHAVEHVFKVLNYSYLESRYCQQHARDQRAEPSSTTHSIHHDSSDSRRMAFALAKSS